MLETPLKLRPTFRARKDRSLANANLNDTHALREQLLKEMLMLDKQRQELESGDHMDFSMVQTYKEMIQARRVLLDKLNYYNDNKS